MKLINEIQTATRHRGEERLVRGVKYKGRSPPTATYHLPHFDCVRWNTMQKMSFEHWFHWLSLIRVVFDTVACWTLLEGGVWVWLPALRISGEGPVARATIVMGTVFIAVHSATPAQTPISCLVSEPRKWSILVSPEYKIMPFTLLADTNTLHPGCSSTLCAPIRTGDVSSYSR